MKIGTVIDKYIVKRNGYGGIMKFCRSKNCRKKSDKITLFIYAQFFSDDCAVKKEGSLDRVETISENGMYYIQRCQRFFPPKHGHLPPIITGNFMLITNVSIKN